VLFRLIATTTTTTAAMDNNNPLTSLVNRTHKVALLPTYLSQAPPPNWSSLSERHLNVLEGLLVFLTLFTLLVGVTQLRWLKILKMLVTSNLNREKAVAMTTMATTGDDCAALESVAENLLNDDAQSAVESLMPRADRVQSLLVSAAAELASILVVDGQTQTNTPLAFSDHE
jgi:hypothetical protein